MKDMIKRVREEKGGFTLAELLIVVAIVLVLVAIAIPVFTGSMDSANAAVVNADIRVAKSEAATKYQADGKTGAADYYVTVSADGNVSVAGAAPADAPVPGSFDDAKSAVSQHKSITIQVTIAADGAITTSPASNVTNSTTTSGTDTVE